LCFVEKQGAGPFFFAESTGSGVVYADMLEQYLMLFCKGKVRMVWRVNEMKRLHISTMKWGASFFISSQRNGLAGAGLSVGRTVHLN